MTTTAIYCNLIYVFVLTFTATLSSTVNCQHQPQCDENTINKHMSECYHDNIDDKIDMTAFESSYMEGTLLCKAYNTSQSYRKCVFSLFENGKTCSYRQYPFSFEYMRIYWKLILSSCMSTKEQEQQAQHDCYPARLNLHTLERCSFSFEDAFPTRCKEFLRSTKCLHRHEIDLVQSSSSLCSKNLALYYFYNDLAARFQLAINVCEQQPDQQQEQD